MLSLARDPEACGKVTPARGPEACDVFSSAMWPAGLRYVSCARDPKARGMLFSQRVVPKCVIGFPGRLARIRVPLDEWPRGVGKLPRAHWPKACGILSPGAWPEGEWHLLPSV